MELYLIMGKISEIKNSIDKAVEEEILRRGQSITLLNLSKEEAILLEACYAGNRKYKLSVEVSLDAENPASFSEGKNYRLRIKYLGRGN